MNKHTPGPWRVAETVKVLRVDGAAMVRPVDDNNYEYGAVAAIPIGKQNANLVAAAPELLDALEALMPYVKGSESFATQYANALAAIAKARGE